MIHQLASIGGPPEHRDWDIGRDIQAPEIGENVQISAFVTVDGGTSRRTTIGPGSFLMAHVHIGHDAILGTGCELAPHASVGGWCELGDGVRVGMGATIRNRVKVGAGARIGMGAVVVKDVPAGETWVGNPARNIQTDPRIDPAWDEWYTSRDRPR